MYPILMHNAALERKPAAIMFYLFKSNQRHSCAIAIDMSEPGTRAFGPEGSR